MAFTVLFVCTANICRSAMAERLLVAELDPVLPISVSSAGVRALTGHAMDRTSALATAELGAAVGGHAARQITAPMIAASDLVLTASGNHRATVLQSVPAALRRTFTMREFARLGHDGAPLDEVTEDALRRRVGAVAALRGTVPAVPAGADSIADPFGTPLPEMRACAVSIHEAVRGALTALGLSQHLAPGPS